MDQLLQITGALFILAAYVAAQLKVLDQRSQTYLWLNLLGSAVLAVLAYREQQWGFFLLEGVWAVVSLWGVARRGSPARGPS